ncbi:MAG: cyclic nucleotide-binding domain-containing protein, partial [Clostridia bacterium]|nr:cyclic nucleotide-binding domain-containing protein [Clostridia bacterium]
MKDYIKILEKTTLFEGVDAESITAMLGCLGAEKKSYLKGEYVLRVNQPIDRIAVLVEGKLHIQLDDYWGNRSIISVVEVAQMFGEAYATQKGGVSQSDVVAVENSTVIFFDINRILTVCSSACRFHALTVRNLFYAVSDKNVKLVNKL